MYSFLQAFSNELDSSQFFHRPTISRPKLGYAEGPAMRRFRFAQAATCHAVCLLAFKYRGPAFSCGPACRVTRSHGCMVHSLWEPAAAARPFKVPPASVVFIARLMQERTTQVSCALYIPRPLCFDMCVPPGCCCTPISLCCVWQSTVSEVSLAVSSKATA
ncbi:unnamed protein product [Polarella glacialis]|uniref:Uncharacterized protein n=1 Tax=Polarella glacialis TaxID=89957 RepID=A0A813K612_POLGL|nr:unnamed protein product [Polarella glacialis]CAE8694949.1 unnamed protein product [Polarella glacialis]